MKYIPEICEKGELDGFIEVRSLTRKERLVLAKELSRVEGDEFDKIEILDKKLEEIVEAVEIKNVKADVVHKSLEEMGTDPTCDELFNELTAKVVQGFPLGKS